jgi:hypothetical protein
MEDDEDEDGSSEGDEGESGSEEDEDEEGEACSECKGGKTGRGVSSSWGAKERLAGLWGDIGAGLGGAAKVGRERQRRA